jgi:tungstate transport system ATP-binding protein
METLIPGTILTNKDGGVTVSILGGTIEAVGEQLQGEKVFCGIRPENVAVDITDPSNPNNTENIFQATIVGITSIGPFLKVTLDCGFPLISYVTGGSFARLKLTVGEKIWASFKPEAVHLILRKD